MEKYNHKIYSCRDEITRFELTTDEVIRLIEGVYHQKYNPNLPNFDAWDQLLACESVAESTPVKQYFNGEKKVTFENDYVNVSVNGNDNGTCKRSVKFELTQSKLDAIAKLRRFNRFSSCIDIASQLEILFQEYPSKEGHWLKVSQYHTPRQINWSINYMLKLLNKGLIRTTPVQCFTYNIIHRKNRKGFHNRRENL